MMSSVVAPASPMEGMMLKYLCICDRCEKEEVVEANRDALHKFFPSASMDERFCATCEESRLKLEEHLSKSNDDAFEAWLKDPNI